MSKKVKSSLERAWDLEDKYTALAGTPIGAVSTAARMTKKAYGSLSGQTLTRQLAEATARVLQSTKSRNLERLSAAARILNRKIIKKVSQKGLAAVITMNDPRVGKLRVHSFSADDVVVAVGQRRPSSRAISVDIDKTGRVRLKAMGAGAPHKN